MSASTVGSLGVSPAPTSHLGAHTSRPSNHALSPGPLLPTTHGPSVSPSPAGLGTTVRTAGDRADQEGGGDAADLSTQDAVRVVWPRDLTLQGLTSGCPARRRAPRPLASLSPKRAMPRMGAGALRRCRQVGPGKETVL